jgi:hypothetical protein
VKVTVRVKVEKKGEREGAVRGKRGVRRENRLARAGDPCTVAG